jgi:hypothetical protein
MIAAFIWRLAILNFERFRANPQDSGAMEAAGWSSIIAFAVLMSVCLPMSLMGIVFAILALAELPRCKRIFAWLGLIGNLLVVSSVCGWYVFLRIYKG